MLITTEQELDEAVEYLSSAEFFVFDVETIGDRRGDPWVNEIVWIGVGDGKRQYSIPMSFPNGELLEEVYPLLRTPDLEARLARGLKPRKSDRSVDRKKATLIWSDPPEHLDRTTVFSALKRLFFDPDLLKVGHNLSFDLGSVAKYLGDIPCGPYADTMILAFLVDSSKSYGYGLKDVAKKYCGMEVEKGIGSNVALHSFEDVHTYVLKDVESTAAVWMALRPFIESDNLSGVFRLEMHLLPVVTRMRLSGAPVDMDRLKSLKTELSEDIARVKNKIFNTAGRTFSLTSNAEKQRLLFSAESEGGRGLTPILLTPKGKDKKREGLSLDISDYSVSADALESFRGQDLLVDQLLEHSQLAKLLSTYVIPYLGESTAHGLVDDGRVHTDFNQIGAATGRLSSRNPNLQNVPGSGTDYGRKIRNLFVAPEGHSLIVADYSQIEPRIIAGMSRDETMIATYRDGGDIYTTVGDTMGVDRKAGKVLVLSIAYGVGPAKIAKSIGCSTEEASDLLNDFAERFPRINRLRGQILRQARSMSPVPYVSTIFGRRRYLPDLLNETKWIRAKAARQAFNTVIQGSAADVMKLALIRVDQLLPEGAYPILTIHDEVVAVAPIPLVDESLNAIQTAMEGISIPALGVPLVAEIAVTQRWGEAK